MARKKFKTSEDQLGALKVIHEETKQSILNILRSLKLKKINIRYFTIEWEVSTPTIFDCDGNGGALGLEPISIETCVGGFEVYAEDEGNDNNYKDNEINTVELVCLLIAMEEIKSIVEDPNYKDEIDWEEVSK